MPEPILQSQKFSDGGPVAAPPSAGELESRIDELLQDISDAASQLGASLEQGPAPAKGDAPPSAPPADLESSLDSVIEDAKRRTVAPPDPPVPEPVAQPAPTEPAPEVSVRQIDETLAKRAEEVMKEEPPAPAPADAPAPDETAHGVASSMSDTAETESPAEAAASEPAADDLVAILASPPPVEPTPAPGGTRKFFLPIRLLAAPFAWPLSFLSPQMRDLVGWFGLVTLFNAVCMWAYLLLH